MKKLGISAATAAWALLVSVLAAHAVTVEIDLQTEGEPVPQATITFETAEGDPIEVALVEEEEEAEQTATEETPAQDAPKDEPQTATPEPAQVTGTGGMLAIELDDGLEGKDVVALVMLDGKLIKKQPMTVVEDTPVQIEAFDPADAEIAVDISQDGTCRPGRSCPFAIAIENQGNGIYEGPVFLEGLLFGNWAAAAAKVDNWFCASTGRGRSLCHTQVSLQPGQSVEQGFSVKLPRRIGGRPRTCLEVKTITPDAEGRHQPVVAALQLGLAREGLNVGRPDGIMGPQTRSAMTGYRRRSDGAAGETDADLFEAIYDYPLGKMARLGHAAGASCAKLALVIPPRQKKPEPRSAGQTRKKKKKKRKESSSGNSLAPAVSIGIGVGIGVLGKKKHKKKYDD
ncbi:MAG: peptidoglycan-binding domain-containing protein [Hyphomicrobiales bacterium]